MMMFVLQSEQWFSTFSELTIIVSNRLQMFVNDVVIGGMCS